jgi:hypothetical protein
MAEIPTSARRWGVVALVAVACAPPSGRGPAGAEDAASDSAGEDSAAPDSGDSGAPPDTGAPPASASPLQFNELLADNTRGVFAPDWDRHDWIELHNPTAAPIALTGFRIDDDGDLDGAHALPAGLVVPAGGHLLLWASGDDDPEDAWLPFRLSAGGETVGLWDAEGLLVDLVAFSELDADVSWARHRDAAEDEAWQLYEAPTPGLRNVRTSTRAASLVQVGATWRYLDAGGAAPEGWTGTAFDDAGWASGPAPLGYGDPVATEVSYGGDAGAKHITTWFRHAFSLTPEEGEQVEEAALALRVDDGAVVYLDGVELLRSNLPAGEITAETRASSAVGGTGEQTFVSWSVDPAALGAGDHVLAVEVHQAGPTSSDIVFDLALEITLVSEEP